MKDRVQGAYCFSCKRKRMRKKDIMELLVSTYWAKSRPWKEMKIAMEHSIPFGVFDAKGKQVGLARVSRILPRRIT